MIRFPRVFETIQIKLLISFLLPIAFLILLGVVSTNKASDNIIRNYIEAASQAINMTGDYLEFGFTEVEAAGKQYINDDTVRKYFNNYYAGNTAESNKAYKIINNLFQTKKATDYFIGDIYMLSGRVKSVGTVANIPDSDVYSELFQTALGERLDENFRDMIWIGSDAYLDEKLITSPNDYSLRMVRNIRELKAVLVIDMKSESVEEIIHNLGFDKEGIIGIITSDGKEIIPDKEAFSETPVFKDKEFYLSVMETDAPSGSDYVDFMGKDYLFLYSRIGQTGAMICALMPMSSIAGQADDIKEVAVIIVIGAGMIAALFGFSISTGINKTIKNIIVKLKLAAGGDLTVSFGTKRKDEFHILINEIQNMFLHIKALIQQVGELSGEVAASSVNVSETSGGFLKASQEISRAMDEIESGVTQQAKDAQECLIQMDSLSGKITLVSENVKEINNIAASTNESIQRGTGMTEELNVQTKSTIEITTEIINKIESLGEKSSAINKIINVISDIAGSTNLLSLNASIEAARAGEAGKGFAVVAGEIRNLAVQSKDSISDIKKIIDGIQEDTRGAVETAKKAEDVMRMQAGAVKNTTESYFSINHNVERLVLHLNEIAGNVDAMEASRASTLGAVESISAILQEVAASTNSVNQTSDMQLESLGNLKESAEGLNRNADKLVQEIQKFKV